MSLLKSDKIRLFFKRKNFLSFRYNTTQVKAKQQKTILHDVHKENNALFKIEHSFYLPDEYKDNTLITTHLHTRSNCTLFDFTYRPILKISGEDKIEFIEKYVGSDIKSLWENECRISFLLNEKGGIVDELLIILRDSHLLVFLSVQCKNRVFTYLKEKLEEHSKLNVSVEECTTHSCISLQGSKSVHVLNELSKSKNLEEVSFMSSNTVQLNGVSDVLLTRCTCTGEDGFDLLIPKEHVPEVYKLILKNELVKPGGLSVLNTLRLESGFCTYGKDINENITPVEANFQWTLGKRRLKELNFNGAHIINDQLQKGTKIKRIGLVINDSSIVPKENSKICVESDQEQGKKELKEIGYITSSSFSPVLQKPIAMGYVSVKECGTHKKLCVKAQDSWITAKITKLPFVPLSIYKP